MTTFQAIVYGIINGFAELLPIGGRAHRVLTATITGWPEPTGALLGALSLGAFMALLIYFRHDWASMISTFLQVLIFRKKPMTLDERLPIFLTLATLPPLVAWYYLRENVAIYSGEPLYVAIGLFAFSLALGFSDRLNRQNKGMFDWNWIDALVIGFMQLSQWLPGSGRAIGALTGASSRNYNREAAAKFMFFCAAPLLAASAALHLHDVDFHAAIPMEDVSWFTLIVAFGVTFFSGLLAIGGLMKQVGRKGYRGYIVYRCVLAAAAGAWIWFKARAES